MKTLLTLLLGLVVTLGLAFAQDTGGATGGSTGGATGGMSSMDDSTGGSATGGSETGGATGGSETGGSSALSDESGSIAGVLSGDPQFSILVQALSAAGLVEELSSGSFTVFAPTDEAFSALPSGELDAVLSDLGQLSNLLQNHVVSGEYGASEVTGFSEVLMLNGQTLPISTSGGSAMIGDATITSTDVQASNGVIHVIDTVLLPSSAGGQTGGSSTGGSDTGGSSTGGSATGGSVTGGSDNDSD